MRLRGLFALFALLTACAAPGPHAIAPSVPGGAVAPEFRISAVGDVMLGGTAAPVLAQQGYDYPFVHVGAVLKRSAAVFGNLEGPLTDGGTPAPDKQYLFRSPPDKVAPALKAAGFTVLSLANNHILDYGEAGLNDTLAGLARARILHAGAGANDLAARQPAWFTAGGERVALLAYSLTLPPSFYATADTAGTAFGHERHVRADVAAARAHGADIVLVSFHWGQEGSTQLRDYQTKLAHAAIDAGADAVIGHHPHILQGIERYGRGVILYSLGNFVFGSYSRMAARSVIAQLVFDGRRLVRVELVPIDVFNPEVNFQPRLLRGADADAVIAQLAQLSVPLQTTVEDHDGVGVVSLVAAAR